MPNIFFRSMMSRVDTLSAERHINMTFVEFLEALARIADKANLGAGRIPRNPEFLHQKQLAHNLTVLIRLLAIHSLPKDLSEKFKRSRPPAKDLKLLELLSEVESSSSDDNWINNRIDFINNIWIKKTYSIWHLNKRKVHLQDQLVVIKDQANFQPSRLE